jgi:hypothetical protein
MEERRIIHPRKFEKILTIPTFFPQNLCDNSREIECSSFEHKFCERSVVLSYWTKKLLLFVIGQRLEN